MVTLYIIHECLVQLAKMNCICHNRELVMELPSSAFPVGCAGCNGIVYGLQDEDCRQVRLPNMDKSVITLKPVKKKK